MRQGVLVILHYANQLLLNLLIFFMSLRTSDFFRCFVHFHFIFVFIFVLFWRVCITSPMKILVFSARHCELNFVSFNVSY